MLSRTPLILIMILLPCTLSFLPTARADSSQWVKLSSNPVLQPTTGTWDGDYVTSPRVLYDGKLFRMWYQGGFSGDSRIGYATSLDGISWQKYKDPVMRPGEPGNWDSSLVALGSVVWNGTMFEMWYAGSNPTTYQNGAIGLAFSTNGTTWVKYAGNPVLDTGGYVAGPYVISLNLTYNMWYTSRNIAGGTITGSKIQYATSYDGVNWTKWPGPVLSPPSNSSAWDSGGVYAPSVIFDGKNFGLWYSALNQTGSTPSVGFASSPDGATWTRSSSNPILNPGPPGSWDAAGVEQTSPVQVGTSYFLYYDSGSKIGLALSPHGFAIPEFPTPVIALFLGLIASTAVLLTHQRRRQRSL